MAPKFGKALFSGIAAATIGTVGVGMIQTAQASDLKVKPQLSEEGGEHSCSGEKSCSGEGGDEKSCSGEGSCSGEKSCSGEEAGE